MSYTSPMRCTRHFPFGGYESPCPYCKGGRLEGKHPDDVERAKKQQLRRLQDVARAAQATQSATRSDSDDYALIVALRALLPTDLDEP